MERPRRLLGRLRVANSNVSTEPEMSPKSSTAKRYPALEALPPLTAEDHAIADREAEVALANLRRNSLAGKNLN